MHWLIGIKANLSEKFYILANYQHIFLLSSVYPVWQTLACAAHLVLAASGANRPFFLFSFFQKVFLPKHFLSKVFKFQLSFVLTQFPHLWILQPCWRPFWTKMAAVVWTRSISVSFLIRTLRKDSHSQASSTSLDLKTLTVRNSFTYFLNGTQFHFF